MDLDVENHCLRVENERLRRDNESLRGILDRRDEDIRCLRTEIDDLLYENQRLRNINQVLEDRYQNDERLRRENERLRVLLECRDARIRRLITRGRQLARGVRNAYDSLAHLRKAP